ncbi:phytoene desaturase family protein [Janibacter alittae]|uniref:Pyridine nucleotide-disulfide oxidoreductase domain-containing protein 2 n=1 Tax=Janibacter alittae TaxID=3115209 RepID=A0ABZ2MJD3_9MICO
MNQQVDAIVIGAGINSMIAASELALAGWSVTLIDERDRIGGFIASDEITLPGYIHDTFSSWHPLFVAGEAYGVLGEQLHKHGLEYANTDDAVTASVSTTHGSVIAHRSVERTVEGFENPNDRAEYVAMLEQFGEDAPHIFGAMGTELGAKTVMRLCWQLWRQQKSAGIERMARSVTQSGRGYARQRFDGWEADQLWAPWLLHAGLAPDQASGGLMFPVMAATMHGFGLPVVVGGAGQFVTAFERLFAEHGVNVITGSRVDSIEVQDGRAVGVRTGGKTLSASKAVLASTGPRQLYEELLRDQDVDHQTRVEVARYRPGRGAMQIHVALSAPLSWSDARLNAVPLVHVSSGSDSTAIACAQAEAGLLPETPTVVVGQQHVLDPGRVPLGCGSLWIQLQELPFTPTGDAAGQLDVADGWTPSVVDGYVDRVFDRIEAHAPGFKLTVRKAVALSPADLAQANRNAVNGDPYGGAAELDQNLLWRPTPRTSRHHTAVKGLWHIGAATHPGPGLGGGSGHYVASRLLAKRL